MNRSAYAPFVMRAMIGMIFLAHGWPKLFGRTDAVAALFAKHGLPASTLLVVLIGAIEIVGGLALLLGLWTRVAAALLGSVMIGAIVFVKGKMGLVGGYELDLLLLAGTVTLMLTGPGAHALDAATEEDPLALW